MTGRIDQARKAIAGVLVPALVVLVAALQNGSDGGSAITPAEWLTVLVAALGTGGSVYAVKNGRSSDPTTSTPEL